MANEAALSALSDWRKSRGLNPKTGRETKPSMGKQLMNTIGAPEYDPNKFDSPDDYVNAVNAHTKNFEIDRTGAINNTKTGETVGYENRTIGPNKTTTVTGYSTVKQPPPTALSSAQAGNWWDKINSDAIEAVKAQIAQQTQALQDQLANNKLLTKQQVDAMNAQLAENVEKMQQIRNVNNFNIAENENRFNGVYSGGLRLRQAANDRSINEGIGNLQRDTQTRSANLWQQYGQLADQAYQKIADLSKQTPEMVQQYVNRALQSAGMYGQLTGQTPWGSMTPQMQNQMFNQGMQQQQFGLQQQGQQFQQQQAEQDDAYRQMLFDYQQMRDSITDQKWKAQFDEDVRRYGLDYGIRRQNARTAELNAESNATQAQIKQNFERGLEIFERTGQMPEFMADFGVNIEGLNNAQTREKVAVTSQLLLSGQETPENLIEIANFELKTKQITPEEHEQIMNTIYTYDPSLNPATQQQSESSGNAAENIARGVSNVGKTAEATAFVIKNSPEIAKAFGAKILQSVLKGLQN